MVENIAINVQNLTKSFGNVLAVNKLNLRIPYGTTYGLLEHCSGDSITPFWLKFFKFY